MIFHLWLVLGLGFFLCVLGVFFGFGGRVVLVLCGFVIFLNFFSRNTEADVSLTFS